MKEIGGYFELELNDFESVFHDSAVAVNSGRNALQYILRVNQEYDKTWVPYYTCDVILQPIKKINYKFEFYSLTENLIPDIKSFAANDLLIYVNYFGIMNHSLNFIKKKFKNVIIDNSQAFYSKPLRSIGSFYSPRKFFGLPDGGFAYTTDKNKIKFGQDNSLNRIDHLTKRLQDGAKSGYNKFKLNDAKLNSLPLKRMSMFTNRLMRNINFEEIRKRRNENFNFIHNQLKKINELSPIINNEKINAPMAYPFLKKSNDKLRLKLIKNKIFVATYWPNVLEWTKEDSWENYLTENLIPLPIDQRYNIDDIRTLLKYIR